MELQWFLSFNSSMYLLWMTFLHATKSSPILSEHRISLQCLNHFMLLELDLQDIPKVTPTSLHLRHSSCRPHEIRKTKAIFRVPFQGCGTTQGTASDHIVFQNAVDNSQENNRTRLSVRHVPQLHYPFACRYRQKYILTLREGETKEERHVEEDGRKGNSTRKEITKESIQSSSDASRVRFHSLALLLLFGKYLWL